MPTCSSAVTRALRLSNAHLLRLRSVRELRDVDGLDCGPGWRRKDVLVFRRLVVGHLDGDRLRLGFHFRSLLVYSGGSFRLLRITSKPRMTSCVRLQSSSSASCLTRRIWSRSRRVWRYVSVRLAFFGAGVFFRGGMRLHSWRTQHEPYPDHLRNGWNGSIHAAHRARFNAERPRLAGTSLRRIR